MVREEGVGKKIRLHNWTFWIWVMMMTMTMMPGMF